ncbi:MAG TPA: class I SAM-dependent methyltransferase [Gaiellaceae bacterium]|nr:class I SAM-dependent methyltransferase [Gaiellaceae bacterium]
MLRRCPLDGATLREGPERLRDNRFGLEHLIRVAWCPSCGLGVTLDPPSQDELDRLYATCYEQGAEAPQLPGTSLAARVWHRVNGSLPVSDERRLEGPVLDVGCNTGETLVVLRDRGLEVVGLEPNPAAAAAARAKGLDVIEQPIEHAELPVGFFGSVILSQVLEHVHEPAAVLQHVRPALRDGGRAYVVVPNAASVWRNVFGDDWVHWHVPFHLWHHTRRSLELLLQQNGFALESARSVTPGEWLLMSLEARRNARRGVYRLEPFRNRFGRRLALAPFGRLGDAFGRGDALYGVARAV